MLSPSLHELSAAQRQRLSFIEFRLWFFGSVTRKEVLGRFDLATAAGTRDLSLYRELAPLNLVYEHKCYKYLPSFKPLFGHPVERVLAALTAGFGDGESITPVEVVPHAVPARLNQPPLETLATVTRAIHGNQPLRLTYHSMRAGAVPREIVPHALVDSGLRWHVRAFDRTKGEFRDLVLTRMEAVEAVEPTDRAAPIQAEEQRSADAQWQKEVTLDLEPHPAHPQPSSIERDFGMQGGCLRVTVRAAVAGYVLRQWQVDCSPDACLTGREVRLRLADLGQLDGVDNAVLAPGYAKQI
ncbi:MAG: WYL domain-containing protein [Rhodoferax sp.]|nr:WYL domain-containing protein [Rhodoferax sp.]